MNSQVSFTLPAHIKDAFSKRAKEKGISMKSVYLAFSEKFAFGDLDFSFDFFSKDSEISKKEVLNNIKNGLKSIKEGKTNDFISFNEMMLELKK